jgi:hypothetical protein
VLLVRLLLGFVGNEFERGLGSLSLSLCVFVFGAWVAR